MRKIYLIIFIAFFVTLLSAQTASVNWQLVDNTSATSTAGPVNGTNADGSMMSVRDYTGVLNDGSAGPLGQFQRWWTEDVWPDESAPNSDRYIEFAVSPDIGNDLTVTHISFYLNAGGTGNMKASVYYSTDAGFTTQIPLQENIDVSREALGAFIFTVNENVQEGASFYLRVYPWIRGGSTSTGKYIFLQDMIIAGDIESLPMPATAIWRFDLDDTPETSGSILPHKVEYSDAMKFYGTTGLPTTDTGESVTIGAIQTVSKVWNAEANPADSLYFQFSVAPKTGGTFIVDSVSMYIGAWFTQNIKAEFYYSQDPTFTEKTLWIADTALPGSELMPLTAAVHDTVPDGETFYLRVYPHNTQAEGWAKLVAVHNVVIAGTTLGITVDQPTVSTAQVTDISTTFARCGGTVPIDGGSPVTDRGVVWNTTGEPTIDDFKTNDGQGTGTFSTCLNGLTPGTTYIVRAFATNAAGTAYGQEQTFTTLQSIEAPTVFTSGVSDILVRTAECGGTVLYWGGDTVSTRGVCWNTVGEPTIADHKTENGSGIGTFASTLYPLAENTTYYVRAYATNSAGTGYGDAHTFTTQTPAPNVTKTVAADGSGDYQSVQAAFDDIPDFYTGIYTIYIKNGVYYEKLLLDRDKVNVRLIGESVENTILTFDDYANIAGGTSKSYSVAIEPNDFYAENITFQNTVKNDGSAPNQQGVALMLNGDRQHFVNCRILGYQDTFYVWGGRETGRVYLKNCYVEGSVDFIFGRNIVLFDECTIHINRNGGTLTAASTEADSKFGLVFLNSEISADSVGFDGKLITSFVLGRPWQAAPRTTFINCYEPAALNAAGWSAWNVSPASYAEYQCYGPGFKPEQRTTIGRQLTDQEAAEFTIENIFAKTSNPAFGYDWVPGIQTGIEQRDNDSTAPAVFNLLQNYPNPFNHSTQIEFQLPYASHVRITVFNALGQQVEILTDKNYNCGNYKIPFNAAAYSSGLFFYKIEAEQYSCVRKMILMR